MIAKKKTKVMLIVLCFLTAIGSNLSPVMAPKGHPEGPRGNDWDLGDEIDTAQDLVSDLLDSILGFFYDMVIAYWGELIDLLDSDILGVAPELIMLVMTLLLTTHYLITGHFIPRRD